MTLNDVLNALQGIAALEQPSSPLPGQANLAGLGDQPGFEVDRPGEERTGTGKECHRLGTQQDYLKESTLIFYCSEHQSMRFCQ